MDQMCSNCKDVAMIEPDGSESGLVCPNCGLFNQDSNIRIGQAPTLNEGNTYHNPQMECVMAGGRLRYTVQNKQVYQTEMIKQFTEMLDPVVQKYIPNSSTSTQIMEMFASICFTKLRGLHFKKKMKYLLACTLICLRDAGIQVLMINLCYDFEVPLAGTIKVVHEVEEIFDNRRKGDTYEREVRKLISDYPAIDQEGLSDKLPKILDLIDTCSFSIGRDRTIVAAHVAYLAIISKNECSVNRIPFNKFLRDNRIKLGRGNMKELATRLIVLIKKMPSVPAHREINFRNFHIHLQSAFRFHKFIRRSVIEDEEAAAAAGNDSTVAAVAATSVLSKCTPPTPLVDLIPQGYAVCHKKQMKRKHEGCGNEGRGDKQFKRIAPTSEELNDDDLLGSNFNEFVYSGQQVEYRRQFREVMEETEESW